MEEQVVKLTTAQVLERVAMANQVTATEQVAQAEEDLTARRLAMAARLAEIQAPGLRAAGDALGADLRSFDIRAAAEVRGLREEIGGEREPPTHPRHGPGQARAMPAQPRGTPGCVHEYRPTSADEFRPTCRC
jgi:hypothetical protein